MTYWLAELPNDKQINLSKVKILHEDYKWVSLYRGPENTIEIQPKMEVYPSTKKLLIDIHEYLQGRIGTSNMG